MPEAIICFLDSDSWEDAVRNAVSLGGDADTQACIAGGIAEAFYGPVGAEVVREVKERLTPDLWEVTRSFGERYLKRNSRLHPCASWATIVAMGRRYLRRPSTTSRLPGEQETHHQ